MDYGVPYGQVEARAWRLEHWLESVVTKCPSLVDTCEVDLFL